MADGVIARCYSSPTLVLLAMDWAAGRDRADFFGFAIRRAPGFAQGERDAYLTNKIAFAVPGKDAQPLPSNIAPFQKFLWWDARIGDADRGRTFRYTITPLCGSGTNDLRLRHDVEAELEVTPPEAERDCMWTCFNRAVVSSQAFRRAFLDPRADLDRRQSRAGRDILRRVHALYAPYRARAIWNETSGKRRGRNTPRAFTLKTARDGWVRGANKTGTPEALARITLARAPSTRPARRGVPS